MLFTTCHGSIQECCSQTLLRYDFYTSAVYLCINALMQPLTIDSSMYDNFAVA